MKLKEVGEFGLIEIIKEKLNSEVIGDDTAPVDHCSKKLLLTTDVLNEGVHFLRDYIPEAVGWKAISVNVSDVVANGGLPKWVLISLNLPEDLEVSFVERFYVGVKRACEFYKCEVV
ncbi:MAG: thiamine-phosphate kinase, partial [Aquifex sp.]